MKKYKLLKDIYDHKMFSIFDEEWYYYLKHDWWLIKSGYRSKIIKDIIESKNEENYFVKFQEYFEEIKDKPKYKVWDYVVCDTEDDRKIYIKIISLVFMYNEFRYNIENQSKTYYLDDSFRLPTPEELETYFR
jgi:hypothetical protein